MSNLSSLKGFLTHANTSTVCFCFRIILFRQKAEKSIEEIPADFLNKLDAMHRVTIQYETAELTCAGHPESVHGEQEKTSPYKHPPTLSFARALFSTDAKPP